MKNVAMKDTDDVCSRRISERPKRTLRAKKSTRTDNGYNAREADFLECGLDLQKEPVAHYHHNDCSDEPVLWAPYQNGGGAAGNHDHDEMPEVPGWKQPNDVPVSEAVSDDTRLNEEIYGRSTERYSPSGLVDWQQYEKGKNSK